MAADLTKVLVTPGSAPGSMQIHHRDFSEIRAEAASLPDAAELLANHLSRALDTALTDWRRESINQAIADVNAFLASHRS